MPSRTQHHRARRQLQFQQRRSIHGGVARSATIRRWQPRQQYSMIYLETRSYGQHVSPQSSVYYNDHAFSLFLPLMRAHCPSLALPLGVSLEPMFLLLVSLPSLALAPAVSLSSAPFASFLRIFTLSLARSPYCSLLLPLSHPPLSPSLAYVHTCTPTQIRTCEPISTCQMHMSACMCQ